MKVEPIYLDDVVQNDMEWDRLHLGVITTSGFSDMKAGGSGVTKDKYWYGRASERITGISASGNYKSWQMQRGHDQEHKARLRYEMMTGLDVRQTGFVWMNPDKLVGSSPDGLIGDDGLVEIKTREVHIHMPWVLKSEKKISGTYMDQAQGQMLVTGRQWVDWVSYCPEAPIPLEWFRIHRDEDHIDLLVAALERAISGIDEIEAEMRAAMHQRLGSGVH
jgi:hypothetical protein